MHYFSNIECVKVSKQTTDLLKTTVSLIVGLTNKADVVEVAERTDVDFLLDLDEHRYELRRCILCRSCLVSHFFFNAKV